MNEKAIRPFDQTLREINAGRLVVELTDELTEVIEAVQATGKQGKLSLTLTLHPRGPDNSQVEVVPTLKGIKPEQPRPISIFYINQDHGLQREDPYQAQLPGLQAAEDGPAAEEKASSG